ncbi:carboxylesterase/lipase family protein [Caulobacter radicis]|uniref:Carboxylic ester hydrolase n=1 Tax=Caulobacter radicis TaxID=2172650 RepID=A0A2T9J7Q2_9CAUL|nr:carboxylesterase family protein [Caulobacter radicis]PVM77529.1 carboxylesterase [Caulobacter radicis]
MGSKLKAKVVTMAVVMAMAGAGAHAASAPRVVTASGALTGAREAGVVSFKGIPYALPPVGELRWRAPQPAATWTGDRAATRFSASCQQAAPAPFGPYTAPFITPAELSEDCLYLNVWAPKSARKLPVYVFIHGGAYQAGGASVPAYDGAGLARKGAVVVTLNYRLGLFGFFAHPELSRESPLGTSGNQGVLDTIAALRWVQANISRFGGDPANVTIAGQSAGAGMVNHLLVSPLAQGLFQRAVMESGPALGIPALPLALAEGGGVGSAAKLKVANLAQMRALPAADLMKAGLPVMPLPITDGKVIPTDPESPGARVVSKVPLIAGYNRDETSPADAPKTAAAFEADVRKKMGPVADQILQLYPHASDAEAARSAVQLQVDRRVAGLILWGERRAADGQPAYIYLFEHTYPGLDPARNGAFHTAEVPYVMGALNLQGAAFTDVDKALSAEMQSRWLSFMRTGDPNPRGARTVWPRASQDPGSVQRFAPTDKAPLLDAARLAVFRDYVAKGGKLGLL